MALDEELRRIAERAVRFCAAGEELAGIIPAEPGSGDRLYLCAYRAEAEETAWLVLDAEGKPVGTRALVRDAVSIAGLCELAEEVTRRGSEDSETRPRVATPAHLDSLGASADDRGSFAEAMKQATGTIDELLRDVERGYKVPLS